MYVCMYVCIYICIYVCLLFIRAKATRHTSSFLARVNRNAFFNFLPWISICASIFKFFSNYTLSKDTHNNCK